MNVPPIFEEGFQIRIKPVWAILQQSHEESTQSSDVTGDVVIQKAKLETMYSIVEY